MLLPLGFQQEVLTTEGKPAVDLLAGDAEGRLRIKVEGFKSVVQQFLQREAPRLRRQGHRL